MRRSVLTEDCWLQQLAILSGASGGVTTFHFLSKYIRRGEKVTTRLRAAKRKKRTAPTVAEKTDLLRYPLDHLGRDLSEVQAREHNFDTDTQ